MGSSPDNAPARRRPQRFSVAEAAAFSLTDRHFHPTNKAAPKAAK